jgi:thioesterase domain-containing protein
MIFNNFVKELKEKDIEISFSGGKLKYSGPQENITPELLGNLKAFKSKLIKSIWPAELGNLMPINPVGSKVPIFIIHGDNGNYIISDYLGHEQPVYGFFHPGSEGEKIKYKSVEEMAKSYLEKIIAVNPTGPYYLIAYSFGGSLAFEIAVQLQKMGHKVPILVLLDTVCPIVKNKVILEKGLFKIIRKNFLGPIRRSIECFFKLLVCEIYFLRKVPVPIDRRTFYMWIKYTRLSNKYSPVKFDGSMLLFKTTGNSFSDKVMGWKKLVNEIRIIEMEGKHLDIFIGKERIELLQKEIGQYIAEVT